MGWFSFDGTDEELHQIFSTLSAVETEIESVGKSCMKYKKRQVKLAQLDEIRAELWAALQEIDLLARRQNARLQRMSANLAKKG